MIKSNYKFYSLILNLLQGKTDVIEKKRASSTPQKNYSFQINKLPDIFQATI
jgi:hypothetical protein